MSIDDYICHYQQTDSMAHFPNLVSVVSTSLMLVVLGGHLLRNYCGW